MAGARKQKRLPPSLDRQLIVLYQRLEQVGTFDNAMKLDRTRCNGPCCANSVELAGWSSSRGGGWRGRTGSLPISPTGIVISFNCLIFYDSTFLSRAV